MSEGFPMFKALGDETRRALNAKRTAIKAAERIAFEVGKAHCLAIVEDRKWDAKHPKVIVNGEVSLKAFEAVMLTREGA